MKVDVEPTVGSRLSVSVDEFLVVGGTTQKWLSRSAPALVQRWILVRGRTQHVGVLVRFKGRIQEIWSLSLTLTERESGVGSSSTQNRSSWSAAWSQFNKETRICSVPAPGRCYPCGQFPRHPAVLQLQETIWSVDHLKTNLLSNWISLGFCLSAEQNETFDNVVQGFRRQSSAEMVIFHYFLIFFRPIDLLANLENNQQIHQ